MSVIFGTFIRGMLLIAQPGPGALDGKSVVDLLTSIQPQLQDFRCEFEGTRAVTDEAAKKAQGLKETGVVDVFGGIFVWKAGGDTFLSAYHRQEPGGEILSEQLVVRPAKNEAELSLRNIDQPIGRGRIDDPLMVNADRSGSLGVVFLLETIKRLCNMKQLNCTVTDETVEGRPLKVVSFSFSPGGQLYQRFWVDLKRGGHAVRREVYSGTDLVGRTEVKLRSFRVGETNFWMPVFAVNESHTSLKNGKVIHPKSPTMIEQLYIIDGTLEFNTHPMPSVFTITHKPGTPITDEIRRTQYEFGRQKPPPLLSKKEEEAMLREQLSKAKAQQQELIATSPERDSTRWTAWLTPAFTALTLAFSIVLLIYRQRH